MTVHKIRPTVVATTECPAGHVDQIEAINPVVRGGELVDAMWSSAFEFCMECEQSVRVTSIEVQR
ncbi:MAG: hypothetical protein JWP74_1714 [Marmoricola sp.]|nr:hypothetical protein [Marmoricola sp.]